MSLQNVGSCRLLAPSAGISPDLCSVPEDYAFQELNYYYLYITLAHVNAGLLFPVATIMTWIIAKRSHTLWKAYKFIFLHILFCSSLSTLATTSIIKPLLLLPNLVFVNLGPSRAWGTIPLAASLTLTYFSTLCLISAVFNSYLYTYMLICHPHLRESMESGSNYFVTALMEAFPAGVAAGFTAPFLAENVSSKVFTVRGVQIIGLSGGSVEDSSSLQISAACVISVITLLFVLSLFMLTCSCTEFRMAFMTHTRRTNSMFLSLISLNILILLVLGLVPMVGALTGALSVGQDVPLSRSSATVIFMHLFTSLPYIYSFLFLLLIRPYRRFVTGICLRTSRKHRITTVSTVSKPSNDPPIHIGSRRHSTATFHLPENQ